MVILHCLGRCLIGLAKIKLLVHSNGGERYHHSALDFVNYSKTAAIVVPHGAPHKLFTQLQCYHCMYDHSLFTISTTTTVSALAAATTVITLTTTAVTTTSSTTATTTTTTAITQSTTTSTNTTTTVGSRNGTTILSRWDTR